MSRERNPPPSRGWHRAIPAAAALAVVLAPVALAWPARASAHAYLTRTAPAASVVLNAAPSAVALTFDEAVEPRFAIISVTDAQGSQQTTGSPARAPANPDTLTVPLRGGLAQGWYLVYWRAISVDGHPVQGAFTFAAGPDPGPAPQFVVPKVSATAKTPGLLLWRWVALLSIMLSAGLLLLRLVIARGLAGFGQAPALGRLTLAYAASMTVGLLAVPVYLDVAVANDSLRSVFDLGALVPLYGVTAFGRSLLRLEICLALFALAGGLALWLDRPGRPQRSVAELGSGLGAALGAVGVMLVLPAAGHPAQTSPRGLTSAFDALHLLGGSVWIGGLVGLLLLATGAPGGRRVAILAGVVPRFSPVALGSVGLIALTGIGQTVDHMPALNALWDTTFGRIILVKAGLLLVAMALASGNLLRTTPALAAAAERPEAAGRAGGLLRRLVGGEVAVVTATVFTAAILTSTAPPPAAFALGNTALAHVGPGRVARTVHRGAYTIQVLLSPNRAAAPNAFALRLTRGGAPVRGATVLLTLNHLQMQMPQEQYALAETSPGLYSRSAPALVMVGSWGLGFQITPPGGVPFTAFIVDQANG